MGRAKSDKLIAKQKQRRVAARNLIVVIGPKRPVRA